MEYNDGWPEHLNLIPSPVDVVKAVARFLRPQQVEPCLSEHLDHQRGAEAMLDAGLHSQPELPFEA